MEMTDTALIQALIAGVDEAAIRAETKWGIGRLERQVSDDTRARFYRQQGRWRDALQAAWNAPVLPKHTEDTLRATAGGMQRAWAALDAEATANGSAALTATVWETSTKDGTVIAIVRTHAEASAVTRDGRHKAVYTLEEIANIIDSLGVIGEAKIVFPGAKVRPRGDYSWVKEGDEVPFG